ncbi:MAG TPA: LptE family protein [Flavobacteriales bacterium]|nr:LptE family protein [Flavobacteriales bacterium]
MIGKFKIAFLLFCISSCAGCKIGYNFSGGSVPAEAKTSSVAMFVSNAPLASPTLPLKITEKLKDQILAQTKLKIVPLDGDLKFSGLITGYSISPVAVQANETAGLNRLSITISVTYVNQFDEKTNFTQSFTRFADYDSSQELTAVEDALIEEINKQLVQDVFDRAFSNW